ncbi:MAG: methylglyoxal synthase [Syntrophotaleaceae bacterium]
MENGEAQKTFIGVLGNNDNPKIHASLASIFHHFYRHSNRATLEKYHFLFSGRAHDRLFYGYEANGLPPLDSKVSDWLYDDCGVTALPGGNEGGVIVLSNLISYRKCSIAWPFFDPFDTPWLRPDILAFLRLSDHCHVKRLMNRGSVLTWFDHEAEADAGRNLQPCPPTLWLGLEEDESKGLPFPHKKPEVRHEGEPSVNALKGRPIPFSEMTVALIAHYEMKPRMIDFAIDHESELNKFGRILATGTTGREVAAATSRKIEKKMVRYHSGPKGGDIEIATAILYDQCHVVIFFVDPLNPHPHIEDVRVVFQSCMFKDQVVMITNEMHAREFMSRVVRGKDALTLYL